MAQIAFLDTILKEYLTFRGFSSTLKALDAETKTDKDFSFRAEKIMDQFNQYILAGDLQGISTLWGHLDKFLFTKLDYSYLQSVKKFESSLYKLYLVTAYNNKQFEKIKEFFTKMSDEIQQQSEWKDWFYFPFCANPEESKIFSIFFTKQWQDTFLLSLRNFLATIYQVMPQPTFVFAEHEAAMLKYLQYENASLKARIQVLEQQQRQQSTSIACNIKINDDTKYEALKYKYCSDKTPQTLDDIQALDIKPPSPLHDDFYAIASEVNHMQQMADTQIRGIKMLIRNLEFIDANKTVVKSKRLKYE